MAAIMDFDAVNIFFTHLNPTIAAEFCCDAHVRKMVVESTQLLALAYHHKDAKVAPPPKVDGTPYGTSHPGHPCAKWAVEDFKQWNWLMMHAFGLANEYKYRFGQGHGCLGALNYMNTPLSLPMWLPNKTFYDPPMCMPDQYKSRVISTVGCYREYIRSGKTNLHVWTRRPPPPWLIRDDKQLAAWAEALVDACDLSCFNADDYRAQLAPDGMSDDDWNNAVEIANTIANGGDPEAPAAELELAQKIFDSAYLQLLGPDLMKGHIAPDATKAEWHLIRWVATEFANGRDPLKHPASGNYTQARL